MSIQDIINANYRQNVYQPPIDGTWKFPKPKVFTPSLLNGIALTPSSGYPEFPYIEKEITGSGIGVFISNPVLPIGCYMVADNHLDDKVMVEPRRFVPIIFRERLRFFIPFPVCNLDSANLVLVATMFSILVHVINEPFEALNSFSYLPALNIEALGQNPLEPYNRWSIIVSTPAKATKMSVLIAGMNFADGYDKTAQFRCETSQATSELCFGIEEIDNYYNAPTKSTIANISNWHRKNIGYIVQSTNVSHRAELFDYPIKPNQAIRIHEIYQNASVNGWAVIMNFGG